MSLRPVQRQVALPARGVVSQAAHQRAGGRAAADGFEGAKAKTVFTPLRRGSTGPTVRATQLKLIARGHLSRSDFMSGAGVFGPKTERAVIAFQTAMKARFPSLDVRVSGVVDAMTNRLLAMQPKPKPEASEVTTDVFEKPPTVSAMPAGGSASRTVTDDEDDTNALESPLKTG